MATKIDKLFADNGNKLPAWAWPGGYPIFYLDKNNSVLCPECANKSHTDPDELPDYKPCDYAIHAEGEALTCDNCNAEIASAYGEEGNGN